MHAFSDIRLQKMAANYLALKLRLTNVRTINTLCMSVFIILTVVVVDNNR